MKRADFKLETLPPHLFMNFRVVDEHGRQLAMGRNLAQLRAELGGQAQQHFQKIASGAAGRGVGGCGTAVATLAVGAERAEQRRGSGAVRAARALLRRSANCVAGRRGRHRAVRKTDDVEFRQAARVARNSPWRADACSAIRRWWIAARIATSKCSIRPTKPRGFIVQGLRRLFALQLKEPIKYLEKNLPGLREMAMQFMPRGTQEELRDQLIDTALDRACLQDPLPADDVSFHTRRDEGRSRLTLLGAGNRAARRADTDRVRDRDEEAGAGEVVRGCARGYAEPARWADRQAFRRRYAVRAVGALPALSEGRSRCASTS